MIPFSDLRAALQIYCTDKKEIIIILEKYLSIYTDLTSTSLKLTIHPQNCYFISEPLHVRCVFQSNGNKTYKQ